MSTVSNELKNTTASQLSKGGNGRKEEELKEKLDRIDFKMVTFSLAGKEYGIDIMKVKEISKDGYFTYVPNSAPFVRGVYNLRGEIISIIDLRIMFHLPVPEKGKEGLEDIIILRLDDKVLGIVVDSIEKVVGTSSEDIQPPHPLFGGINIQYINGVVENDNLLYIILDVERIFGKEAEEKHEKGEKKEALLKQRMQAAAEAESTIAGEEKEKVSLGFIEETLATFRNFYVTELNRSWVEERFRGWQQEREGKDVQLQSREDADKFLAPFYSRYSGELIRGEYLEDLKTLLSGIGSKSIQIWNPGSGKGYEAFILAGICKNLFPDRRVKVWANDNDLLAISTAPNLVFQKSELPDFLQNFLVESNNGHQFGTEIKDAILFEYHDILHENPYPEVDCIFARDVLSFLTPEDQEKLFNQFHEKLKPGGFLILGDNEKAPEDDWDRLEEGKIVAFKAKNQ